MNHEDILSMARESGLLDGRDDWSSVPDEYRTCIQHFAALVSDAEAKRIHDEGMVTIGHMREQIAAEREACANVCDEVDKDSQSQWPKRLATMIRARGQA